MERILREVYGILYDLDKLTEDEYNKLISVYGKKLVDKAIEDLIFDENDERNLVKFNVYLAKNVSYLETTTDMSIYEIYLTDVSSQIVFDAETNDKYMNKILENWHTAGFKTRAEVEMGDVKPSLGESSFDVDEFFSIAVAHSNNKQKEQMNE